MNFVFKIMPYIISIPKTIYIYFKCLKLKEAIKFPILISYKVKLYSLNKIYIESPLKLGLIKIGFANSNNPYLYSYINLKGILIFKGKCSLGTGIRLEISSNGKLTIGKNYRCNINNEITCRKSITFGDNNLVGWDCYFCDNDGHKILNKENKQTNLDKSVSIGDNVWICKGVNIFKGSIIKNGVIIAANSTVLNEINKENCLIGGYPARIIKENICWKM